MWASSEDVAFYWADLKPVPVTMLDLNHPEVSVFVIDF